MVQIYSEYSGKGLEIIAFPCNQFGSQEPGNADEIYNYAWNPIEKSFPIPDKHDSPNPYQLDDSESQQIRFSLMNGWSPPVPPQIDNQ